MPQDLSIGTTQHVNLDVELAPIGDRILAYFIDSIIQGAYLFVVVIVFSGLFGTGTGGGGGYVMVALLIILLIPFLFYHLLFEVYNNGQTIGKKSMRIKVAAIHGGEVSFASYLLRWLFRFVDISLTSGVGALIAIAVTDNNQRIGDLVANTTVIRTGKKVNIQDLTYVETDLEHEITYPEAIRLTAEEADLIKDVLRNRDAENIDEIIARLSERICRKLEVPVPDDKRNFLRVLFADYAYLNR